MQECHQFCSAFKQIGLKLTYECKNLRLTSGDHARNKVVVKFHNGRTPLYNSHFLKKWYSFYYKTALCVFFPLILMFLVPSHTKVRLEHMPFAILHLWKENKEIEQFQFEYLGLSIGQVPYHAIDSIDPFDIDVIGDVGYVYLKTIGKVITQKSS